MSLVGRVKEQDTLDLCLRSGRPEFVAVYGRRRVGKTFLVRQYFREGFAFYATGMARAGLRDQLRVFGEALREYGCTESGRPKDWLEAFARLRRLLSSPAAIRDRASGRLVVFLDELPWFDNPRSGFKSALEHFWNSWGSACDDLVLIVCGSATSWIMTNLVNDHGGLHNRITRQIHLQPFTLGECEAYFQVNNIPFTRQQMAECYMVFGGIPYYLNLIDRRMSLAQNIDALCFDSSGQLRFELDRLYKSLFKSSERHMLIVRELSSRAGGLTRTELAKVEGIGDGHPLTKALAELEECGFVRSYREYSKRKKGRHYQLVDPFTLFSLRFLQGENVQSWSEHVGSPGYWAWCGLSFELVCLLHVKQIKAALGVSGVASTESAWKSKSCDPGAQIDLLIDRKDSVINICEMKYSGDLFVIDAETERVLRRKLEVFANEQHPRAALHLTMVTMNGVAHNKHYGVVTNEVTAEGLFAG